MLTEMYRHSDSIALTKGLLIAARRLSGDGLALSVCFADTSPREGEAFRTMNREEVYSTLII